MEVTVNEAKTHLSRLLRRVECGEEIVIRRGAKPVALLTSAPSTTSRRVLWGNLTCEIAPNFDEEITDFKDYQ